LFLYYFHVLMESHQSLLKSIVLIFDLSGFLD